MLKILDSSRKYIVIVTGCRMLSYDKQKFKDESMINFINLHNNYLLTQKLKNQNYHLKIFLIFKFLSDLE